jgi:hypothetical protein
VHLGYVLSLLRLGNFVTNLCQWALLFCLAFAQQIMDEICEDKEEGKVYLDDMGIFSDDYEMPMGVCSYCSTPPREWIHGQSSQV